MPVGGEKQRGRTGTLAWTRALDVIGSEYRLCDGIPAKTQQRWRLKGVPAYRIVQLLNMEQPSHPTTSSAPLTPDEVACMADATGQEAFRKLAMIFRNRSRRPDIWEAITHNLNVFARAADDAATSRQRVTQDAKARRQRG